MKRLFISFFFWVQEICREICVNKPLQIRFAVCMQLNITD
jgi:hypothetical protein